MQKSTVRALLLSAAVLLLLLGAVVVDARHSKHHSKKKGSAAAAVAVAGDYESYRGSPYTVGWDERTFLINGARKLILSGSVHYPRSTPSMWPGLLKKVRAAGLNTVETYVFWNVHEPLKREYDFATDRLNLPYFLECAAEAGLFVVLRIGPYACAEWNYGGLPIWTRSMGMTVRTMDSQWMFEMKTFVAKVLDVVEPLLARNGGPIILAQIENEYGNIEGSYGKNGTEYVKWCAQTALDFKSEIPWIMCQQDDAPATVVNTCNGFYCDGWVGGHQQRKSPAFHTENWGGWFQSWGSPFPTRPTEDVAFSVARFIQRGGTATNYYMFHGGTSFGRTVGGPYITTSYDYDVQLNEFGVPSEPKYTHTSRMHHVLAQYEAAIVQNPIPTPESPTSDVEIHAYGNLVFVASSKAVDTSAVYRGLNITVPAWSVTMYDWTNTASPVNLFCTSKISTIPPAQHVESTAPLSTFTVAVDVIGGPNVDPVVHAGPIEQTLVTEDLTDYLWYSIQVQVAQTATVPLTIGFAQNYVYIFLDAKLVFSGRGWDNSRTINVAATAGSHTLTILTMSMGLSNYGAFYDQQRQGVQDNVTFAGVDLSKAQWSHKSGLVGELKEYFTLAGSAGAKWLPFDASKMAPFTWYRSTFHVDEIKLNRTYSLNLASMGKGAAYVNGHHLGRYWSVIAQGTCNPCPINKNFDNNCYTGCGEPSQTYYHIPRDWLTVGDNLVVLLEETAQSTLAPQKIYLRVQEHSNA